MTDKSDELEQDEPEEDEVGIDWLDALHTGGPSLHPESEFTPRCSKQSVALEKSKFEEKLLNVLRSVEPSLLVLDPQFTEHLFRQAVSDWKQMGAWNEAMEIAKSEKLKRSVTYVKCEIKRYAMIRKLLLTPNTEQQPGWMFEWRDAWIDSFFDHTLDILGQLSAAYRALDGFAGMGSLGRTNFETHLIALAKPSIREAAKKASLKVELKVVIAAYAHASRLVPAPDAVDSSFIDAVNMRVSRARKSKEILEVLSAYLMHDV